MPRWRIPRLRFSLLALLLGVLLISACLGLWWRWEPWILSSAVECPGSISEVGFVPQSSTFFVRQFAPSGTAPKPDKYAIHGFDARTLSLRFSFALARPWSVGERLPDFSPDGRYMVTYDGSGLLLVDLADGEPVALGKKSGQDQQFFGFSDNGRLFSYLTDGTDNGRKLRTRDLETGREWQTVESSVLMFRAIPNRAWALPWMGTRGRDFHWSCADLRTGEKLPPGLPEDFAGIQVECDEKASMLVVSGRRANGKAELAVWRPEEKAPRFLPLGDSSYPPHFQLSPDGRWLRVQVGPPVANLVFNLSTGEKMGQQPEGVGHVLSFLPRNRALLSSRGKPSSVHDYADRFECLVWDLSTQTMVCRLEGTLPSEYVRITKDGRRLMHLNEGRCWDLDSGRLLFNLGSTVRMAKCSPDEARLVADLGENGPLSIVDAWTGTVLQRLVTETPYGGDAVFSPDGRQLLAGRGQDVYLWTRRRPEYWWGLAWLPELWIAALAGAALLFIAARRLRSSHLRASATSLNGDAAPIA